MKTHILMGDIRHAGRIEIQAESPDEAIRLAEAGEFTVFEEQHKDLGFDWNGEEPEVVEDSARVTGH